MTGMNSAVIWLVLVIVLLAIEIATLGLTTVCSQAGRQQHLSLPFLARVWESRQEFFWYCH